MSLNPRIGHLYHDNTISNTYTVLDAREQLKTREINARESKQLDKYSQQLERAKNICRRHNEWEQVAIRKQLDSLHSKTPSLARGLRKESERLKRYEESLASFSSKSSSRHSSNKARNSRSSSWSVFSHAYQRDDTPAQRKSAFSENKLDVTSSGSNGGHPSSKIARLISKAEQITRSLHRLYTRGVERRWRDGNKTIFDVLENESNEELRKALVLLKGTPAGHLIDAVLQDREDTAEDVSTFEIFSGLEANQHLVDAKGEVVRFLTGVDNNDAGISGSQADEIKQTGEPVTTTTTDKEVASLANVPESVLNGQIFTAQDVADFQDDNVYLEVFERDDPRSMSSTVVNPSESDWRPSKQWTELFKPPELWKVKGVQYVQLKPAKKQMALVTIAGRQRKTMMKKI